MNVVGGVIDAETTVAIKSVLLNLDVIAFFGCELALFDAHKPRICMIHETGHEVLEKLKGEIQ